MTGIAMRVSLLEPSGLAIYFSLQININQSECHACARIGMFFVLDETRPRKCRCVF